MWQNETTLRNELARSVIRVVGGGLASIAVMAAAPAPPVATAGAAGAVSEEVAADDPAAARPFGPPPALTWPVDCDPSRTCFVQNHVDHDPTTGVQDFRCGGLTYDGHDGVDVRVFGFDPGAPGVTVRAAVEGVVGGARDGEPDALLAEKAAGDIAGKECGNGLRIVHEGGWSTQYCHLKQGSIRVAEGDRVARGQTLGEIGLSGATEFPHLHFVVRRGRQVVDPFVGPLEAPFTCEADRAPDQAPMWIVPVEAPGTLILRAGFTDSPPPLATIDTIPIRDVAGIDLRGPLLLFALVGGTAPGQTVSLDLRNPAGNSVVAEEIALPTDRPKAQWLQWIGARPPVSGWPEGSYTGVIQVRDAQGRLLHQRRIVQDIVGAREAG